VDEPGIDQARERLNSAAAAKSSGGDPETAKQAMDDIQEAKKLLAKARKKHLKVIRQIELDKSIELFKTGIRQYARPAELGAIENLTKTAQREIDNNSGDFESHLDELRGKNFMILWRQDWFVIDRFKWLSENSFLFPEENEHAALCKIGKQALQANDTDKLRQVVAHLDSNRIGTAGEDDMLVGSNILVG
jgi:molecular chaperone DnaK